MIKINEKEYTCPVEVSIDLIAGKWKILILWHLQTKTLRFGQLRKRIPGITQKMLTQQLRELESDNLILRTVYPVVPPKVEYSLSQFGETLKPLLASLLHWGNSYAKTFGESDYDL